MLLQLAAPCCNFLTMAGVWAFHQASGLHVRPPAPVPPPHWAYLAAPHIHNTSLFLTRHHWSLPFEIASFFFIYTQTTRKMLSESLWSEKKSAILSSGMAIESKMQLMVNFTVRFHSSRNKITRETLQLVEVNLSLTPWRPAGSRKDFPRTFEKSALSMSWEEPGRWAHQTPHHIGSRQTFWFHQTWEKRLVKSGADPTLRNCLLYPSPSCRNVWRYCTAKVRLGT